MSIEKRVSTYINKPDSILRTALLFGAALLIGWQAAREEKKSALQPPVETEDIEAEDVTNNPPYNKTTTNV